VVKIRRNSDEQMHHCVLSKLLKL